MSDIFTIKEIPNTEEFGMLIKNFRAENKVTARSLIEKFDKSASYFSKLEKGEIKKIKSNFLIDLCDFITKDNDGIKKLLKLGAQKYDSYTKETRTIIFNIDELLIEHLIPQELVEEINTYMHDKNITTDDLINQINKNQDLEQLDVNIINKMPYNEWSCLKTDADKGDEYIIKISMLLEYLNSFLSNNIKTAHSTIIQVILFNLYSLGKEDAGNLAKSKMRFYKFKKYSKPVIRITNTEIDELFSGMPDEQIKFLQDITTSLKLISILNKEIAFEKLKQISDNFHADVSFNFAYISQDLTELEKQPIKVKQQFLKELIELIEKTINVKKEITQPNLTDYL